MHCGIRGFDWALELARPRNPDIDRMGLLLLLMPPLEKMTCILMKQGLQNSDEEWSCTFVLRLSLRRYHVAAAADSSAGYVVLDDVDDAAAVHIPARENGNKYYRLRKEQDGRSKSGWWAVRLTCSNSLIQRPELSERIHLWLAYSRKNFLSESPLAIPFRKV